MHNLLKKKELFERDISSEIEIYLIGIVRNMKRIGEICTSGENLS